MSSTAFTFLAGLPAVLGFGAFIFYLFLRHRGAPDLVTLRILDMVQNRSGKLPEIDPRLSGKQVASLLNTDDNLRKVFTEEELGILDGIRISERRQQWFAFIFLSGTVTLSLVLYLVLVWKPWQKPTPHPINHFAVDFSMSRPITPDMEDLWKTLREKAQSALDTGDSRKQFAEGFTFIRDPERANASGVAGYKTFIYPNTPIHKFIVERSQNDPPDIGAIRLTIFIATFIFTDSPVPKDINSLDIDALNKKMQFMISSLLNTTSSPLSTELDFFSKRYRVFSSSHIPSIVNPENWIRTWEDLAGVNLFIIMEPLNGEGWVIDFVRFHSELGLQYSLNIKAWTTHDRALKEQGASRIFTASLR